MSEINQFKNEPLSSLLHLIGACLSVIALIILVGYALVYGTVWHVVGFSIFGAALILLYTASTLFHFFRIGSKVKNIFLRIDHSFIYILIAATYTPVCLTVLRGPWGWSILGIVWTMAALGITLKARGIGIFGWFSTVIYVIMGWVIVVAIFPLLKVISLSGFLWLLFGGISYTVGALFFGLDIKYPRKSNWSFGFHELFHVFVMVGSFLHFWFMMNYLI